MNHQQVLSLPTEGDHTELHYMNGGNVVATFFESVKGLRINAQLGDDNHVINFSFEYSGPLVIVYTGKVRLVDLESQQPQFGIMAIMSAVTTVDVSLWIAHDQPVIIPGTIRQFDAGIGDYYQLAQELICHHTRLSWDKGFLNMMYQLYMQAACELVNRLK